LKVENLLFKAAKKWDNEWDNEWFIIFLFNEFYGLEY